MGCLATHNGFRENVADQRLMPASERFWHPVNFLRNRLAMPYLSSVKLLQPAFFRF